MQPGDVVTTSSFLIERDAAIGFAKTFDPQPMHIDETAARNCFYGELIVSGWQVLSLTMRLCAQANPFPGMPLIGVTLKEVRFLRPIFPETEIAARIYFEKIERSAKKRVFYILRIETFDNASGKLLIEQFWRVLKT